ncbi:MAG: ABC transporter ATP-binding protein [Ardenticatenaceae bacterium]|nr:ABC transporter ATP-binding protein [Anaerolineales bacterium]MCB8921364.1 ABC transporter ATP-binding protein [Ardenticatenaceae bacterium]MCB8991486.1 ABC transporter ATP-binding protein [Ardenticatenaceae bacterium]MCB9004012.1 ABC transporter ATP-binding protein [Ardenticatenaceae bacterium]
MSSPVINTQKLRKEFGTKVAVADLTLQVGRGEVFGFLGPNGAGKTTSVKMLLGLTRPTAGTAVILNQPLGHRQTRAKIGFLPEHFRFHEWLRADEFLDLHGRLYDMSTAERTAVIPDLLELVGLADRADTKLQAFSKGMLQRIGLAQALLNSPELVFLDEPTSGLDPLGRRLVRDIINGLRDEGTTVFLNSHLLSEVEQTCDRVAFIRNGRILQTLALDAVDTQVQITLRVGQPTPQLLAELAQFGEHVRLNERNGRIHLTLPHESTVPQLAQWLITNDYTLYELNPQSLSLEERFLQIVGTVNNE